MTDATEFYNGGGPNLGDARYTYHHFDDPYVVPIIPKEQPVTKIQVLRQPAQAPTHLDHLTGELSVETDTYTDGTTTEVFIKDPEVPGATTYLGRGVARRRKGDPRNVQRGHVLGLARALRDWADQIEASEA